jgi:hypothetical protein
MHNKRFTFKECELYFQFIIKQFPIGTHVKYRHIGNGHNPTVWGYNRHRVGKVVDYLQCDNPYYLYKVKLVDIDNNHTLTVHPDLINNIDE